MHDIFFPGRLFKLHLMYFFSNLRRTMVSSLDTSAVPDNTPFKSRETLIFVELEGRLEMHK